MHDLTVDAIDLETSRNPYTCPYYRYRIFGRPHRIVDKSDAKCTSCLNFWLNTKESHHFINPIMQKQSYIIAGEKSFHSTRFNADYDVLELLTKESVQNGVAIQTFTSQLTSIKGIAYIFQFTTKTRISLKYFFISIQSSISLKMKWLILFNEQ